jgi:gliding motility-associated-like protein
LNLRVNPVEKTFINDTICQGESYNKYGFSLPPQTIAGTNCDFTLQLLTVQGCDSIVTLCLTVNKPAQPPVFASICEGESYYFHDNYYYVSGIYEHYVSGCGGIDTLVLTVNPTYYSEQTDCICPGEIYTFNGYNYDREGDYIVTLKTVNGCDSILYLRLPPCPPEMCCMPVIPNTFTPDGINNIFMRGYRIQIYTRNGLLLYDGKDGWDGTYKGRPVEKDTYFYILYCPPTIQGIETKNGYIVLIR